MNSEDGKNRGCLMKLISASDIAEKIETANERLLNYAKFLVNYWTYGNDCMRI